MTEEEGRDFVFLCAAMRDVVLCVGKLGHGKKLSNDDFDKLQVALNTIEVVKSSGMTPVALKQEGGFTEAEEKR